MRVHVLAYREVAEVPIASLGHAALRAWVRKVRDDGKVKTEWRKGDDGKRTRTLVRGGPLAPYSTRNHVNSLTAFFADMLAEERIDLAANPMEHPAVRREVPEAVTLAGKHTIVHMCRETAEHLPTGSAVREGRRVRYLLAFTSGMAEGELSGLTFEDVILDADIPIAKVTKALARFRCTISRCEPYGRGRRQDGRNGWGTSLSPPTSSSRTRRATAGARTRQLCCGPTFAKRGCLTHTKATT